MSKRWVVYDYDLDELVTNEVYKDYDKACETALYFDNSVVVSLGDVGRDEGKENEGEEEDG